MPNNASRSKDIKSNKLSVQGILTRSTKKGKEVIQEQMADTGIWQFKLITSISNDILTPFTIKPLKKTTIKTNLSMANATRVHADAYMVQVSQKTWKWHMNLPSAHLSTKQTTNWTGT